MPAPIIESRDSSSLRRWRDELGPAHLCALARIGLALLLADETHVQWRTLGHHFFRDVFNWPMLPDALMPSRPLFTALLALQLVLATLILVGRGARPSLLLAGLFQLYVLACDRNGYHNYRYTFALSLVLLSLTPCDRALAWRRPTLPGPLWAQRLLQLQVTLVYVASAGSKLCDPDWRSGRVISDGVARFANDAVREGAPAGAVAFIMGATVAGIIARLAIATELGLGAGLWSRRLRPLTLWIGVFFHVAIQIFTSVAIFSALMLVLYLLFARPELHERVVRFAPEQRRRVQLIRALDWLRRFRYEPSAAFAVIDRDGQVTVGAESVALIARATPLPFLAWPALWLYARLRR